MELIIWSFKSVLPNRYGDTPLALGSIYLRNVPGIDKQNRFFRYSQLHFRAMPVLVKHIRFIRFVFETANYKYHYLTHQSLYLTTFLYQIPQDPSLETIHGPCGFTGSHPVPNIGHSSGLIFPIMTSPHLQAPVFSLS